jgi:hypothetical protein
MPGDLVNPQSFSLKPFQKEGDAPDIRITGTIGRRSNSLSVGYALKGNLSDIRIPAPEPSPARKDHLWGHTCLELFLGMKGSERYWEFNLSPAGHWNVYRFTSYRKDMREEPAFTSLPFRIRMEQETFRLSVDVALGKILPEGQAIDVAIGAIVRDNTGATSHWALAHPGLRPDFHRRDGFRMFLHAE